MLAVAGGVDLVVGGVKVTSNEPLRPLLASSIFLVIYVLSGGSLVPPIWLQDASARGLAWIRRESRILPGPRGTAWTLTAAVVVVAWFYGTKAVGGADSYGYLSQSDLWAEGSLKVHQPIVGVVPWSDAAWSFAPVGSYRPMSAFRTVEGDDEMRMVPVYPPGLPLLLAAFGAIGGFQAKFLVFPLFGALTVLATYYIGVRLASKTAALVGTWLLATSPPLLFMIVSPMSDAVVSGLWATAFLLAMAPGRWRAIGAGVLMSAALLTRPNLAPVTAIVGCVYLFRLVNREKRRSSLRDCMLFGLTAAIGPVMLAFINQYLYGSPTASGYGRLESLFSPSFVPQNLRLYFSWLLEVHTPLALVGMAATLVPIRRLWPSAATDRSLRAAMALSVLTIWATYLLYMPWDAWWYLRFLLPSFPFIMLGIGAVYAMAVRPRGRIVHILSALAIVALGILQVRLAIDRSAFRLWSGERRYVAGARMANAETERNSLIFTGIHVGSVRYYGSRMSLYHESFPERQLDSSLRWLSRRGVHPYLLIEDWEVPTFRERFQGQRAVDVLSGPPIAMLQEPGKLMLYDLLERQPAAARPSIWSGVDSGIWAAPKAPTPRLEIRE